MVEKCQEFNNTKRYKAMNKVNLLKFNIYFLDYNIFFFREFKGIRNGFNLH